MSAQLGMVALSQGLGLVKHWMNVHYQSKVDIARIEAQRDVMLAAISSTKELMEMHLTMQYAERASVLSHSFRLLEQSIESKNVEGVQACLVSIQSVVQQSPLKGIQEFQNALGTNGKLLL
ncbi:MAG: hypothetical protein CL916_04430 [Deltaproteobacteria bacterium]|nr:hypothetical protein [Deltaproteobacteria bacterium]